MSATASSKSARPPAIRTWAATISTSGWWTGWRKSFSAIRASICRKDRQALQRLTEAAEKAKIELSSAVETTISLPFITADASGPKHLEMKLTRAKFDQLTADLVERCVGPVKQALADAKITERDIDEVILVGGATRIPAVQALVRRLTGGKEAEPIGESGRSRRRRRGDPGGRAGRRSEKRTCCST